MPHLPTVSWKEAVSALERAGWEVKKRGNHIIMTKPDSIVSLSIPTHKEIAKGTLRKLIRLSGLTVNRFSDLLKK